MALSFLFVSAQEKDKWQRIYTYEDSIVEMNKSKVVFVNNNIGRVDFRTVFKKPEPLREKPGVKYKTRLETIEFKCAERRYRIYQLTLLDDKGKAVYSYEMKPEEEWLAPKSGGMMSNFMSSACSLISEKRRNP
jgi:hypothetical protein